MKLIVQPESGVTPLVSGVRAAKSRVEIIIFRFDLKELQRALELAVARGVYVHALIAHTNRGGEKRLRKLELALLKAGVMVSRTGDDLLRYHGKMMIIDRTTLYALGFNCTHLDIAKSRSIGVVTRHQQLVQEAVKLFEADAGRQVYVPGYEALVVSPENSRAQLAALIKGARSQLLIYDPKINDRQMIRLLQDRVKAGVDVRVLGKMGEKGSGLRAEKLPKLRLHVRAILRDGRDLFVGSQSLRSLELDKRREVGVIVRDRQTTVRFAELFEEDWSTTSLAKEEKKAAEQKAEKADKSDKAPEGRQIEMAASA